MDKKLLFDRYFKVMREEKNVHAYQNIKEQFLPIFEKSKEPFVVTTLPKRKFFKNGKLLPSGITLYFAIHNQEEFHEFKKYTLNFLKKNELFYPKFIMDRSERDFFKGTIKLDNFIKK